MLRRPRPVQPPPFFLRSSQSLERGTGSRGVGRNAAALDQEEDDVMASNRLLHAMLSVRDINASLNFYKACGMKVLSYAERPNGAATAFVGFGEYRDAESFALELTAPSPKSKQGQLPVDLGDGFLFMSVSTSQPLGLQGTKDPDGYVVRCGEPAMEAVADVCGDRFRCLCLRVSDLDVARQFYCSALGMVEADSPMPGLVDEGDVARIPDLQHCVLRYLKGGNSGAPAALVLVEKGDACGVVEHGTGFDHVAVSTLDVHAAAAALNRRGADVFLPPTVMFGINISGVRDPDGYSIYLTDEAGFRRR